jgi:hypothetical protein
MSHKVRSVYRVLDFSSLGKDCNFLLLSVLRYMKIFHESSAECVIERLILRRGHHPAVHRQVRQKPLRLCGPQLIRMPQPMKPHKTPVPPHIRFLGPQAILLVPHFLPNPIFNFHKTFL